MKRNEPEKGAFPARCESASLSAAGLRILMGGFKHCQGKKDLPQGPLPAASFDI
jgi:hypothetical protein